MTSPVAVVGLVWDDDDLQRADLDVFFEITEGLDDLPETRGSDQVIPFRRGRLVQPRWPDGRPIVALGHVTGPSGAGAAAAYRGYVDDLKARLDPTGPARLLVATLEDGTKRWINAVPRDLVGGPALGADFRPFSIRWDAPDPFWYGAYGIATLDSGLALDTGRILDGSADIVIAGSGDYVLANPGSADSQRVRVVINGPSSGPVTVEVTGSQPVGFSFGVALAAGQTLTVDNHDRTVSLATKFKPTTNARKDLSLRPGNEHGEYLRLRPGAQTIRVSGAPATTRINFLPTYS